MMKFKMNLFTLIELLVVISIIAILAGMLLPSINSARKKALAVQCVSNIKQISLGLTQYLSDYKGMIPPVSYANYVNSNGIILSYISWAYLFSDLGYAPKNTGASKSTCENKLGVLFPKKQLFACPATEPPEIRGSSYGINYQYSQQQYAVGKNAISMYQVRIPSLLMILSDSAGDRTTSQSEEACPYFGTYTTISATLITSYASNYPALVAIKRHSGGANSAFLDGHVEPVNRDRLPSSDTYVAGKITFKVNN